MLTILLKVFQGIFLLAVTALLSLTAVLGVAAFKWSQELPSLVELDALKFTATTQIFARNGELIGEILPIAGGGNDATTNRIPVGLESVSPAALAAIIASEDDQFFKHYGFDIPAIAKAAYLLVLGEGGRGGSTITTQVIKNTLLADIADEESLERKAKEVMLAVELERRLTKAEILQRYINVVYWGGNLYGIRAASRAYFDKDPIELNLAEGLYLARLITTPSKAYNDFEQTRTEMRNVLDKMLKDGVISEQTAQLTWNYPLQPTGWQVEYDDQGDIVGEPLRTSESLVLATTVSSDLAPHVTWSVRNELNERFGLDRVFGQGGLRVFTTIDTQAQHAANAASRAADVPPGAQIAIVGLDPETGEVLAMVGERIIEGEPVEEFNRAAVAERQPGSSFKPIIYATAVEVGSYTQSDLISDEATAFAQPGQRERWEPQNHDKTFIGLASLRHHLNISRNIPVAKLVQALTPQVVAARANELGYSTVQPYLSLSLGAFEATPLQHASGMGAFANKGVHVEPYLIERVEDASGNVLYEATPRRKQVWREETAYIMLDLLHGNVNDSGAFSRRAKIGERYVAGKTGTTNNERDIWFVGLTPGIVAAVWIGYDDNRSIPSKMPDGEQVTSSRQPIYIWRNFVEQAVEGRFLDKVYPIPENIEFFSFDPINGAPNGNVRGAFLKGSGPSRSAATVTPIDITIPIDKRTNKRADSFTPPEHIEWRLIRPEELSLYTD